MSVPILDGPDAAIGIPRNPTERIFAELQVVRRRLDPVLRDVDRLRRGRLPEWQRVYQAALVASRSVQAAIEAVPQSSLRRGFAGPARLQHRRPQGLDRLADGLVRRPEAPSLADGVRTSRRARPGADACLHQGRATPRRLGLSGARCPADRGHPRLSATPKARRRRRADGALRPVPLGRRVLPHLPRLGAKGRSSLRGAAFSYASPRPPPSSRIASRIISRTFSSSSWKEQR